MRAWRLAAIVSVAMTMATTGWGATSEVATAAPASAAPAASLLSNGDFEAAGGADSVAPGWFNANTTNVSCVAEGTNHFMRLHSTEPDKMVLVYRAVPIKPEYKALELSYRVRYQEIKVGKQVWFDGRIMMNFKDAGGKVLGSPSPPIFRGTKNEWEPRSQKFRVPGGAAILEIVPALFQAASGTLDFDDFRLAPIPASEITPPPAPAVATAGQSLLLSSDFSVATEDQLPKPPVPIPPPSPSTTMVPANPAVAPPELHVAGNQVQTSDGKMVWLQGLCIDSLEWGAGEHILQSIPVAIEQWKANAIRLPVMDDFWFGRGGWPNKKELGVSYRQLIDAAVEAANSRGAYLVLDLHRYGWPTDDCIKFWKDAAVRYRNNPGVIFELLNEPHSTTWEVWQKGGTVEVKQKDGTSQTVQSVGMQALVDAIRSTGARNMAIAGGLAWGYDLSGVVKGYALHDQAGGDGIMYSSHLYPWFKDWQTNTLDAAAKYPIFVGEIATPPDWKGYDFIPMNMRTEDLSKSDWATDVLGMIQKYKLNWTGFSFHPTCGPPAISDWNYTPTPYWGVYVKDALAGKTFEMKRMR